MKESLEQLKSINDLHQRINFTSEFSTDKITFLDLCFYTKGRGLSRKASEHQNHIKPTNTQQYVHASSAHPPGTASKLNAGSDRLTDYFK